MSAYDAKYLMAKWSRVKESVLAKEIGNAIYYNTLACLGNKHQAAWADEMGAIMPDDKSDPWPDTIYDSFRNLKAGSARKKATDIKVERPERKVKNKSGEIKISPATMTEKKFTKPISIGTGCKSNFLALIATFADEALTAQPEIEAKGVNVNSVIRDIMIAGAKKRVEDGVVSVSPIVFSANNTLSATAELPWLSLDNSDLRTKLNDVLIGGGLRGNLLDFIVVELLRFIGVYSVYITGSLFSNCKPVEEKKPKAEAKKPKAEAKSKEKTPKKPRKPLSEGLQCKSVSVSSQHLLTFINFYGVMSPSTTISLASIYIMFDDFERSLEAIAPKKSAAKSTSTSSSSSSAAPTPPASRPVDASVVPGTDETKGVETKATETKAPAPEAKTATAAATEAKTATAPEAKTVATTVATTVAAPTATIPTRRRGGK